MPRAAIVDDDSRAADQVIQRCHLYNSSSAFIMSVMSIMSMGS